MVILHPTYPRRPQDHKYQVPHETLTQLQQTPWCLNTLSDTSFLPLNSHSRTPPPHLAGRYTLMGKTLATQGTISTWQGFYKPFESEEEPDELRILLALGLDMDGHLNTAHGGVAALMLDEAMGTLAGIHKEIGKAIFTAYMHIDYKRPVPTPSVCLIRVRFDAKRSAKRKIYVNATLESGEGVVYTTAESLFLETERKHGPKI
jgi:thioesterase superfamily protein 4